MKCSKCNFEWNEESLPTKIEICPFCQAKLNNDVLLDAENSSFGSLLKEMERKYGKEIWKEKSKAIALFKDLAPKRTKEKLLLIIALELKVFDCFEEKNEKSLNNAQQQLLSNLGSTPIEDIITAVSELYGIEYAKASIIDNNPSEKKIQKKSSFAALADAINNYNNRLNPDDLVSKYDFDRW